MTEHEKPEFAEIIGGIAVSFRQEATKPLLRAYWMGLGDLELGEVKRAATKALRACRFMPTVAELRELAGEANHGDRAQNAWAEFERAVGMHGGYRSVDFADPLINATVRALGGWTRCCDLDSEEFDKWLRKDFVKQYEAFCKHPPSDEAMGALSGVFSRENALLGYEHKSSGVVKIGTNIKPLIEGPKQRQALAAPSEEVKQIADARRVT